MTSCQLCRTGHVALQEQQPLLRGDPPGPQAGHFVVEPWLSALCFSSWQ